MKLAALIVAIVIMAATIAPVSAAPFRPDYWTPQASAQWHTAKHEARQHRLVHHRPQYHTRRWTMARRPSHGHAGVIGGRPRGCPYEYCGCSASLFVFHRIIAALNLAANWLRFPRVSYPEPGDAAVAPSRHHVVVLEHHVRGPIWYVHDGNSGRHLTRDHARDIAGWTIVDPTR